MESHVASSDTMKTEPSKLLEQYLLEALIEAMAKEIENLDENAA